MIQTPASDRMVQTAIRLFHENGIFNTGVDQIIEESCSARGTLYSRFGSKSGLIAAALKEEGEQWRSWFFEEVESRGETPYEQLLAMFDVLASWFKSEDYTGCLFMNAVSECRSQDEEVMTATLHHKKLVKGRIRGLAKEAGASNPSVLTQQLDLIIDGLIITALATHSASAVSKGKAAAKILIDSAIEST